MVIKLKAAPARDREILRIALSYMMSNLDDVCECFRFDRDDDVQCPECGLGTVVHSGSDLWCGGCLCRIADAGAVINYNNEIIPKPLEAEIEHVMHTLQD